MYNKKKYNKKVIISFITILLIILLIISVNLDRKYFIVENYLKDGAMSIEKIIMYPFTALSSEKNVTQSESYLIQKNVNASLEKEIAELKEELELNKTLTEYEPVNATILSRNKSYWFNTITIDKGKSSGIKEDMAVITKNGLIGKITKVSDNSSEVKLITSSDINFKVSVAVKTNDDENYAILNGYNKKTGLIKASGIDKTTTINKGDEVVTSGLGGVFPSGIYIGTVVKIKSDKYDLSKTIYIKTYQNFNDIHYVTVLKVNE
jgi:rod shape-determining protein MreC